MKLMVSFLLLILTACVPSQPLGPMFNFYSSVRPSIYKVFRGAGGGTGFKVLNDKGEPRIATNAHICRSEAQLQIQHELDQSPTTATVENVDTLNDVCVLIMAEDDGRPALSLASVPPKEGDLLATQGHGGLERQYPRVGIYRGRRTLSIRSENLACNAINEHRVEQVTIFGPILICVSDYNVMDIAMEVTGGCSGSPLFNVHNEVVGIIFAGGRSLTGAISVSYLKKLLVSR